MTKVNTQWEVNRKDPSPLTELLTPAYWSGSFCTHLLSRVLYCTHYVLIAGAAAYVALETFAYLDFGRVGIILKYLICLLYTSDAADE